MSIVNEEKFGTVKISDEVVAVCAGNTVLNTEGVAELSGGFSNMLSKNILGKELLSKGLKISQSENNGLIIDVYVIVKYGVKIPAVAWDIQENVKNAIEDMLSITIEAVNIHVQGVDLPDEEEQA